MGVVVFSFSASSSSYSFADSVVLLPWVVVVASSLMVVGVFSFSPYVPSFYDESVVPLPSATVTSTKTLSIIESALAESISMSSYSRDPAF
jgi:hypothetical protein